jgi:hypothetical protein
METERLYCIIPNTPRGGVTGSEMGDILVSKWPYRLGESVSSDPRLCNPVSKVIWSKKGYFEWNGRKWVETGRNGVKWFETGWNGKLEVGSIHFKWNRIISTRFEADSGKKSEIKVKLRIRIRMKKLELGNQHFRHSTNQKLELGNWQFCHSKN